MFTAWKEGPEDKSLDGVRRRILEGRKPRSEKAQAGMEVLDQIKQGGKVQKRMAKGFDKLIDQLIEPPKEKRIRAKASKPQPITGMRANTTAPWTEWAAAAGIANPGVRTIEDLRNIDIPSENVRDPMAYIQDLERRDPEEVKKWLERFHEQNNGQFGADPSQIYLSGIGGGSANVIPEGIRQRLHSNDTGDVFFIDGNGELQSLDVKTTTKDYLGGQTLDTFLNTIQPDRHLGTEANGLLRKFLQEQGIPHDMDALRTMFPGVQGLRSAQGMTRELRDQFNMPFRQGGNPYWDFAKRIFQAHPQETIDRWLDYQYPDNVDYSANRYDGEQFSPMNRSAVAGDNFEFQHTRNPSNPNSNDSKMWWTVNRNDKPFRKVEIRRNDSPWASHKMQPQNWQKNDQAIPFDDQPQT